MSEPPTSPPASPPEFSSDAERRRASADRMRRRESAVDEQIKRAQEDGAFDNLPGKGKPLVWRDDANAGDMALAFHMMASAGYAPDWIERGKELRQAVEDLERRVGEWQAWHEAELRTLAGLPERDAQERTSDLNDMARSRRERFDHEAEALNERIRRYNLTVPVNTARIDLVDVAQWLAA